MTVDLKLEDVAIGVFTPRMAINQDWVEELAEDIKKNGQLKPIIVQSQSEPPYPVIDGEHRVYAIKQLNLDKVRAEIRKLSDEEALYLAMRINELHGLHLDSLEEGKQMVHLQEKFGWTQEKLGEMFGHSQQWVSNRITLYNNAGKELKNNLYHGVVTFTHAREIVKLPESEQPQVLNKVTDEKLNAKHTKLLTDTLQKSDNEEKGEILEKPIKSIASLYPKAEAFEEAVKAPEEKPAVELFECPNCGNPFLVDWNERTVTWK